MVSDLPKIQSDHSAQPLRVFVALTYDLFLDDWVVKFLGIFRCYSCLAPPRKLLTAYSEESFVV